MKKWAVITGTLVLLVGLLVIPFSNKPQQEMKLSSKTVYKQWSIEDNFVKGQNMTLDFQQSYDWSLEQYDVFDDPPYLRKYLFANVTDPVAKTNTTYKITLVVPRGIIGDQIYTTRLEVFSVNVTQHGSMIVEDQPKIDLDYGINLGTTSNAGLYIVTLYFGPLFSIVLDKDINTGKLWIHETFPPAVLRVHNLSTVTTYPNAFLLPVGGSLVIIGIIAMIWGAKSAERKRIRKQRA